MTDVFLICFSVVNPASFQNVKEEWVPELKEYAPNVPFLLIGTQVCLLGFYSAKLVWRVAVRQKTLGLANYVFNKFQMVILLIFT